MHMKVIPPGKVEVVVPRRIADQGAVHSFVAANQSWLHKQLSYMARHYAGQTASCGEVLLPDEVRLPAVEEYYSVSYCTTGRASVRSSEPGLLLVGGADSEAQQRALCRWLQRRAEAVLPPWLEQISREVGLPYRRVAIRAQKSRWGSCSSQKNISLNRASLFLSPLEVRYLMIHELCHTVHLNHSAKYWSLVAKLMPEYDLVEARLRRAMHLVPLWALRAVR